VTVEAPKYRTGALWGVLTVLLLVGTSASAFFIWGLTDLVVSGRYLLDLLVLVISGAVTTLAFLLLVGILYRVDRIRGVPHRRMELFD
jgi:hypothetical protein